MKKNSKNLEFLEELRSIAQLGLNYTKDPFDRERYQRLLLLTAEKYSSLSDISVDQILSRFCSDLGHITPKVGVDAAVFSENGRMLLVKRTDDNLWSLPCGWAEVNESPQESVRRELLEETGLNVDVLDVIDVFSRMPGSFGQPHTSCHILFHCVVTGGTIMTSSETSAVVYREHRTVTEWHKDHGDRAEIAYRYWKNVRHA